MPIVYLEFVFLIVTHYGYNILSYTVGTPRLKAENTLA